MREWRELSAGRLQASRRDNHRETADPHARDHHSPPAVHAARRGGVPAGPGARGPPVFGGGLLLRGGSL